MLRRKHQHQLIPMGLQQLLQWRMRGKIFAHPARILL
jgi:hypothetical protein